MAHQIILTDQAPAPIGPYSQAVKAGNTVYVSGQIPFDAAGQLVPGDITAQTHQVLKNLTAILAAAGLTLADVVKCSIFVKDLGDFATINQVYGSYFDEATAPARETRSEEHTSELQSAGNGCYLGSCAKAATAATSYSRCRF